MTSLKQRAIDWLSEHSCANRHLDRTDPVCGVHGFLWPEGRAVCNGNTDPGGYQIIADLAASPEAATTPATPGDTLGGVGRLLELLADGRGEYADRCPEGSLDRSYLAAQADTCRLLARILTDPTTISASLFLPLGRLAAYEGLLAELGLAGPDRGVLSDVALLYRQTGTRQ